MQSLAYNRSLPGMFRLKPPNEWPPCCPGMTQQAEPVMGAKGLEKADSDAVARRQLNARAKPLFFARVARS
jgi:hypothetical protein